MNQGRKYFMSVEELQRIVGSTKMSIRKIEEKLGMPHNTLQQALKGVRKFPEKWEEQLKALEVKPTIQQERPDYECCILNMHFKTYCGRERGFNFVFHSVDHAINTVSTGSRLIPCRDCSEKITKMLTNSNGGE